MALTILAIKPIARRCFTVLTGAGRDRTAASLSALSLVGSFPSALSLCLLGGCASSAAHHSDVSQAVKMTPPRLGPDFPNPESFYPIEARRLLLEGSTVVHYCVDATGNLSGPPTVATTSGNADLDSGAILLAAAGNGHYIPATRNGIKTAGCAVFKIRFKMWEDPRWPTLAPRLNAINAQFARRCEALKSEWHRVSEPNIAHIQDPAQLELLRQYIQRASTSLAHYVNMTDGYFRSIDEAVAAPDIPESERRAFISDWALHRDDLRNGTHQIADAVQGIVSVLNELLDYLQKLRPPSTNVADSNDLTPQQRANVDALMSRAVVFYERIQAVSERMLAQSQSTPMESLSPHPSTLPARGP